MMTLKKYRYLKTSLANEASQSISNYPKTNPRQGIISSPQIVDLKSDCMTVINCNQASLLSFTSKRDNAPR